MKVVIIMACALVGTIVLLFFAGTARWGFIYLIRYRWLKHEVKDTSYEMSGKRDVVAVIIAVLSMIVFSIVLIYGLPFVIEHFSELPVLR